MPKIPRELLGDAPIDHVGFLTRDLDADRAFAVDVLGLEEARSFDLSAEHGMSGSFYVLGDRQFEIFTIHDADELDRRLAGRSHGLDHIALKVSDLDTLVQSLTEHGVRFQRPARDEDLSAPIELRGAPHIWTRHETTHGMMFQLIGA